MHFGLSLNTSLDERSCAALAARAHTARRRCEPGDVASQPGPFFVIDSTAPGATPRTAPPRAVAEGGDPLWEGVLPLDAPYLARGGDGPMTLATAAPGPSSARECGDATTCGDGGPLAALQRISSRALAAAYAAPAADAAAFTWPLGARPDAEAPFHPLIRRLWARVGPHLPTMMARAASRPSLRGPHRGTAVAAVSLLLGEGLQRGLGTGRETMVRAAPGGVALDISVTALARHWVVETLLPLCANPDAAVAVHACAHAVRLCGHPGLHDLAGAVAAAVRRAWLCVHDRVIEAAAASAGESSHGALYQAMAGQSRAPLAAAGPLRVSAGRTLIAFAQCARWLDGPALVDALPSALRGAVLLAVDDSLRALLLSSVTAAWLECLLRLAHTAAPRLAHKGADTDTGGEGDGERLGPSRVAAEDGARAAVTARDAAWQLARDPWVRSVLGSFLDASTRSLGAAVSSLRDRRGSATRWHAGSGPSAADLREAGGTPSTFPAASVAGVELAHTLLLVLSAAMPSPAAHAGVPAPARKRLSEAQRSRAEARARTHTMQAASSSFRASRGASQGGGSSSSRALLPELEGDGDGDGDDGVDDGPDDDDELLALAAGMTVASTDTAGPTSGGALLTPLREAGARGGGDSSAPMLPQTPEGAHELVHAMRPHGTAPTALWCAWVAVADVVLGASAPVVLWSVVADHAAATGQTGGAGGDGPSDRATSGAAQTWLGLAQRLASWLYVHGSVSAAADVAASFCRAEAEPMQGLARGLGEMEEEASAADPVGAPDPPEQGRKGLALSSLYAERTESDRAAVVNEVLRALAQRRWAVASNLPGTLALHHVHWRSMRATLSRVLCLAEDAMGERELGTTALHVTWLATLLLSADDEDGDENGAEARGGRSEGGGEEGAGEDEAGQLASAPGAPTGGVDAVAGKGYPVEEAVSHIQQAATWLQRFDAAQALAHGRQRLVEVLSTTELQGAAKQVGSWSSGRNVAEDDESDSVAVLVRIIHRSLLPDLADPQSAGGGARAQKGQRARRASAVGMALEQATRQPQDARARQTLLQLRGPRLAVLVDAIPHLALRSPDQALTLLHIVVRCLAEQPLPWPLRDRLLLAAQRLAALSGDSTAPLPGSRAGEALRRVAALDPAQRAAIVVRFLRAAPLAFDPLLFGESTGYPSELMSSGFARALETGMSPLPGPHAGKRGQSPPPKSDRELMEQITVAMPLDSPLTAPSDPVQLTARLVPLETGPASSFLLTVRAVNTTNAKLTDLGIRASLAGPLTWASPRPDPPCAGVDAVLVRHLTGPRALDSAAEATLQGAERQEATVAADGELARSAVLVPGACVRTSRLLTLNALHDGAAAGARVHLTVAFSETRAAAPARGGGDVGGGDGTGDDEDDDFGESPRNEDKPEGGGGGDAGAAPTDAFDDTQRVLAVAGAAWRGASEGAPAAQGAAAAWDGWGAALPRPPAQRYTLAADALSVPLQWALLPLRLRAADARRSWSAQRCALYLRGTLREGIVDALVAAFCKRADAGEGRRAHLPSADAALEAAVAESLGVPPSGQALLAPDPGAQDTRSREGDLGPVVSFAGTEAARLRAASARSREHEERARLARFVRGPAIVRDMAHSAAWGRAAVDAPSADRGFARYNMPVRPCAGMCQTLLGARTPAGTLLFAQVVAHRVGPHGGGMPWHVDVELRVRVPPGCALSTPLLLTLTFLAPRSRRAKPRPCKWWPPMRPRGCR